MPETRHFINQGYGWTCKRCHAAATATDGAHAAAETNDARANSTDARARFFHEGEAEEREPTLSAQALARWRDPSHDTLVCPRCGAEEGMRAEG
ncbi:MAG TPA: hypothetical protein VNA19_04760 [Pyrinomonadaceae bacterium]|nr:hypothetical protein [Pyrinomonadaceae bacterium]